MVRSIDPLREQIEDLTRNANTLAGSGPEFYTTLERMHSAVEQLKHKFDALDLTNAMKQVNDKCEG